MDKIFARVDDATRNAALACAKAENRTLSQLMRHVLIEYLRARGYLPAEPPPDAEPVKPKKGRK